MEHIVPACEYYDHGNADGRHVRGDRPTKEIMLHLAVYARRPGSGRGGPPAFAGNCGGLCIEPAEGEPILPALTGCWMMRIGRFGFVPYFLPGDPRLAKAVGTAAEAHAAVPI